MTVNDNEFAHVVRVNSLRVHLLAMLVSLIRFAHGKMLPSVASISFAVNCSLWSRQSFALLMGNAPAGRVIHSLRSWGNAPAGRVSYSLRSWEKCSRWSRQSFAALMGNAPFGRVIQLRCYLLTLFALFIRCAHGECSLRSRQSFATLMLLYSLRSCQSATLLF